MLSLCKHDLAPRPRSESTWRPTKLKPRDVGSFLVFDTVTARALTLIKLRVPPLLASTTLTSARSSVPVATASGREDQTPKRTRRAGANQAFVAAGIGRYTTNLDMHIAKFERRAGLAALLIASIR